MDLLTASIIISILYLIAMIVGTYLLNEKCENIWAAILLAWIIIPGAGAIWIPCLAHIGSEIF
jgi:hypothetical protein